MALFLGAAALALPASASAAELQVGCSVPDLRAAIISANDETANPGPDTLSLAAGCVYSITSRTDPATPGGDPWYGPNGLPAISSAIIIEGRGATIERSTTAFNRFRLFYVGADPADPDTLAYTSPGPGELTLRELTLRGGLAQGGRSDQGGGGAGLGGAIYNQGALALERATIMGAEARGGMSGIASGLGEPAGAGMGEDAIFGAGGMGPGDFAGATGGIGAAGGGGGGGFRAVDDGGAASGVSTAGSGGGPSTGLGASGGIHHRDNDGRASSGNGSGSGGDGGRDGGGSGGDFGDGGGLGVAQPVPDGISFAGGGGGGGVGGGGGASSVLVGGGGGGFGGGGGASLNGIRGGDGGFGGGGAESARGGFAGGDGAARGGDVPGGGGAGLGGAIFNHQGEVELVNSTLSGNTASGGTSRGAAESGEGLGGALFNLNGEARVTSSTLAGNVAPEGGGALYSLGYDANDQREARVTLRSSVLADSLDGVSDLVVDRPAKVARHTRTEDERDEGPPRDNLADSVATAEDAPSLVERSAARGGGSLQGSPLTADPALGALADNGGPTHTHAPAGRSPAVDAGPSLGLATDQRGVSRPQARPEPNAAGSDGSDIGAVELEPPPASAELSIFKAGPSGSVRNGQAFSYTLTVANAGPSAAQNVVAVDDLPEGLAYDDAGSDVACEPDPSSDDTNDVRCAVASVPSGSSESFAVRVVPSAAGDYENQASVSNDVFDGDGSDDRSNVVTTEVVPSADLSILKQGPSLPVADGESFEYTLTVSNAGPDAAQDVVVADDLPDSLAYDDAGSSAACEPDAVSPGDVRCSIASLVASGSQSLTVRVTARGAGEVENTASVSSDTADPDATDDRDAETTRVSALADLSIEKSGPAEVRDEQRFAYTLRAGNAGPSAASAVRLSDSLPAGVEYLSASGAACSASGRTVTCAPFPLASGAQRTIILRARAKTVGEKVNRASVRAEAADPDPSNDADTATTTVSAPPPPLRADLSTAVTAPDSVGAGERFAYSLRISNGGPDTARRAVARLRLSAGQRHLDLPAGCSYDRAARTVACALGDLSDGAVRKLELIVVAIAPGPLAARGSAASETGDPAPANDASVERVRARAESGPRPPCTIVGTAAGEVITGTRGNDVICAGAGRDLVRGGAGDDAIYGGAGDDILRGEGGADRLFGQAGRDIVNASDGVEANDLTHGGEERDLCSSDRGDRRRGCP